VCRLQAAGCRVQAAGCKLQAAGCKLTSYKLTSLQATSRQAPADPVELLRLCAQLQQARIQHQLAVRRHAPLRRGESGPACRLCDLPNVCRLTCRVQLVLPSKAVRCLTPLSEQGVPLRRDLHLPPPLGCEELIGSLHEARLCMSDTPYKLQGTRHTPPVTSHTPQATSHKPQATSYGLHAGAALDERRQHDELAALRHAREAETAAPRNS